MGTPYEFGPVEFEATGGQENCIELKVPHRGIIRNLRLRQIGGTAAPGTFRILTKEVAAAVDKGDSEGSVMDGEDPGMYSIFGDKSLSAGGVFEEYDVQYHYSNQDGTPTNPVRRLWLVIEPDNDGTFAIAATIETSLLN